MGRSSSPHWHLATGRALSGPAGGPQLIDPSVANIALVNASANLTMEGPTLALAASASTPAQAATVLHGLPWRSLRRRRILAASLLLAIAGNLLSMLAPTAARFCRQSAHRDRPGLSAHQHL